MPSSTPSQRAEGALGAAVGSQDALETAPSRVRLGLHTGPPLVTEEGYVGHDVHFAARGGRLRATAGRSCSPRRPEPSLADGAALTSLGSHRLKDVAEPVTIYQLGESSFPPLKTIANSNLPTPASSFLGRDAELYEADLQLQETRLLTVTGPGGEGKTRFALELAQMSQRGALQRLRGRRLQLVSVLAWRPAARRGHDLRVSLNVREQPGQTALEALSSHLAGEAASCSARQPRAPAGSLAAARRVARRPAPD